ncbi:MAG: GGDEF domain-containing protein [Bdellovibrionota bacterium]
MSQQGDSGDKTAILKGESDTLKTEREAAKDHPPCLIIIRGTHQGKSFEISKSNMFIGRDVSADIVINDQNASRKHAEVIKQGSTVQIRDNNSTNGTFVNDKPVKESITLRKEDMIKIGSTILKYLPAGELEIFFLGTLESAAHTDPLTRVYNRGYIMESLEAEFKRAKALHQDLSLIVMDLDYFKRINDQHGHHAGDYVLKEFCNLVRTKILPKEAILGRYGGEEFLVLLPGLSLEAATQVGEQVRSAIEKFHFKYDDKRISVTTSVGVAELALDVDSHTALFKLADKAVYQAKSSGRNQVCTAG